jgi:hypothetical protein
MRLLQSTREATAINMNGKSKMVATLQESILERHRQISLIGIDSLVRVYSSGDLGLGTVTEIHPSPGRPYWQSTARVHMADGHWNGADLFVDLEFLYPVSDPVTALGLLEEKKA